RSKRDWSSDVCSADLHGHDPAAAQRPRARIGRQVRYRTAGEHRDLSRVRHSHPPPATMTLVTDEPTEAHSATDHPGQDTAAEDQRAESLRAGLDAYELEESDWEVLAGDTAAQDEEAVAGPPPVLAVIGRSEEHTSELQSRFELVCRLLLGK